ncbi:hypothetical protein Poli38472_004340 [Pythium oligandrum]|uniref:Integrator complex subunit 5 C-terminal domain-containing protein n=1 Tax=Pythium oligandrum TaxID=41045 RepID=A0A8K1C9Q4_PYTOL|nr:hypothetical protein Poli38472_004340 [Pythium oligandrum]|eukprot:TMW59271.1 hypothetical protein Poli38472_004340 [Pythium oligandrum]
MDLQLNAVEDDGSASEHAPSPAPPPFTMPVRRSADRPASTGVSMSSLLSADSPAASMEPRRHSDLSTLMSFPSNGDEERGHEDTHATQRFDGLVRLSVNRVETQNNDRRTHTDADDVDMHEDNEQEVLKVRRPSVASADESPADPVTPVSPHPSSCSSPASVAIHVDALVLSDPELVALKSEFHAAVQKYLGALAKGDQTSAPPAKRHRKGKHQKKRTQTHQVSIGESLQELEICISRVDDKVTTAFMAPDVLREVVRFCLAFTAVVNGADPVIKTLSTTPDFDAALRTLDQKPVHLQLVSIIRRAVLSGLDDFARELLVDVPEWCLATRNPQLVCWLLVFLAQVDSYTVMEFLLNYMIHPPSEKEDGDDQCIVVVLEYLAGKNTMAFGELLSKSLKEFASVKPTSSLRKLITLVARSKVISRIIDDSFQWIVTKDTVSTAWSAQRSEGQDAATSNGDAPESVRSWLLRLVSDSSKEMRNSGFQLILLLQDLMKPCEQSPKELAHDATLFHQDLVRLVSEQHESAFLANIYQRLPYIAHTVVERLAKQYDEEVVEDHKEGWQPWLALMTNKLSRHEVMQKLLDTDLVLYEVQPRASEQLFASLVLDVLGSSTSDYVTFLRQLVDACGGAVSNTRQHRLLALLRALRKQRGSLDDPIEDLQLLPIELDMGVMSIQGAADGVANTASWNVNWSHLELWRSASGSDSWDYLLDLVQDTHRDPTVAAQALELLKATTFPSLEDPVRQFRCLRKLSLSYFRMLTRYRTSLVHEASRQTEFTDRRLSQLESLRLVIARVVTFDGAVAHYGSSVFTQFVSLWVDALLSTVSATSVPTHFPAPFIGKNDTKDEDMPSEPRVDEPVIRSERTISSKCTNLQSSQVITRQNGTLVYRKALDASWEREMDVARVCSMYATQVLTQVISTTASLGLKEVANEAEDEEQKRERRLKALVDLLLERAIPCCGIPSDDLYKETLPNRSSFDMDLRIEQWLNHFPAFLPLLRLVVTNCAASPQSAQALRLVPLIKSALVVLLGHWNSVKGELDHENMDVPPYMRNRNQLALSCELMQILRLTGWLPAPLARTAELLPLTTPADIRSILFSCWFFLADHPPPSSPAPTPSPATSTKMPLEFYLLPVRKALHRNIHKIGAQYPLFMC